MKENFTQESPGQAPEAVIAISRGGEVLRWDKGAETIFGFTAEEAVGRRLNDLIVPSDRVEEEHRLQQVVLERGLSVSESIRPLAGGGKNSLVCAGGAPAQAGDSHLLPVSQNRRGPGVLAAPGNLHQTADWLAFQPWHLSAVPGSRTGETRCGTSAAVGLRPPLLDDCSPRVRGLSSPTL